MSAEQPSVLFSPQPGLKIGMVVGEASGDLLGADLMSALCALSPGCQFAGIGGPKMEAMGFNSLVAQERLAVGGYWEVLKRLPELLSIRRRLRQMMISEQPDVFIGIDAPDFNLALEGQIRSAGIPTIHYVSPSVWAWRPERVEKIGHQVDHVLCLFPMEPPIYVLAGIPVTFVGHPLASKIAMDSDRHLARQQLGLFDQNPVFAVLPGSRVNELAYMVPSYVEAMRRVLKQLPDAQFVVPLATEATRAYFQRQLTDLQAEDLPVLQLDGQAPTAMIASDVVLVTSGTATLEVALTKRPMVICYKLSALTARIIRRKLNTAYIGLPNILLGESYMPELLQQAAQPEKIAVELLRIYHDHGFRQDVETRFTALHQMLKKDSGRLAAEAVLQVIHEAKAKDRQ